MFSCDGIKKIEAKRHLSPILRFFEGNFCIEMALHRQVDSVFTVKR